MAKRKRYTDNGQEDGRQQGGGGGGDDYGNQSLPVALLPPDFDGIPMDGATYLAMVRQEAATHPSVYTATHNPYAVIADAASTSAVPVSRATELGIPNDEWRAAFLERFKAMREALSLTPEVPLGRSNITRMPKPRPSDAGNKAWFRFIFRCERPTNEDGTLIEVDDNDEEEQPTEGVDEDDDDDEGETSGIGPHTFSSTAPLPSRQPLHPTPALLMRFTTGQILSLLHHLPYWITIPLETPPAAAAASSSASAPAYAMPQILSQWAFALLAKLDTRLVSDDISTLRTLARASIASIAMRRMRLAEAGGEGEGDDEDEEQMAEAEAGAWTVVNIVAGLWGQRDLWEAAEEDLGRIPRRTAATATELDPAAAAPAATK